MKLPAFLRRSLRNKVTALVVATTLAALAVAALALLYYNVGEYRETELAQLRTQAAILGRASAAPLAFNDAKEAARALGILGATPAVEIAALYGADGRLFVTFVQGGVSGADVPQRASAAGTSVEDNRIAVFYPIVEQQQALGTVYLRARSGLTERLLAYLGILAAATGSALAAALLLSAWLQRAVTAPLLGLAEAARRVIDKRDFSVRAGKSTDDEIGVLAEAMNAMLAGLEREIAERTSAEEALRTVDRRKDEFLATLAHELRNPLAPVRNALYLMQAAPEDAAMAAEARAIIDRQVRQRVRLVDDLLDVSRITTGKLALRRENVELRAVASSALEAVEPLVRQRGHTLAADLPPPGVMVNADPTRLAQVLLNLLNNAAKFTPPGGRIEFSVGIREGELVARVSDNGIGIAPQMLSEIFEMFAQADLSLERTTGGLGVGLSLSRRLVELHGGTLEAASEGLGGGARFVVRMPVVAARAGRAPASASPASAPGGRRLLLVDDNNDFVDSLARVLQRMGHQVRVEYDGEAGLSAAREFRPQVAFLDIGMPRMNGFELARRLRAESDTAAAILIAVTGWGQAHDRRAAKEAGFDDYLVKPVEVEQIERVLQAVTR